MASEKSKQAMRLGIILIVLGCFLPIAGAAIFIIIASILTVF